MNADDGLVPAVRLVLSSRVPEDPGPEERDEGMARWGWPALVAWAAGILYGQSIAGGIYADDWFQVRHRSLREIASTFLGDWNTGAHAATGFYRPLIRVSFGLDNLLWQGWGPGYHITNILLLLALLAGVYRCAIRLTGGSRPLSCLAGLSVAAFPYTPQAVCWLSGRTDLQAAALLAWALFAALSYAVSGGAKRLFTMGGLLACALLTKEVAAAGVVILPLAVQMLKPADARGRRGASAAVVCMLVALGYGALRLAAIGGIGGYHASRAEPLTVHQLARGWGAIVSGVFAPVSSWGAPSFGMRYAVLGALSAGLLVVLSRFRRHVVFCILAAGLSCLPMAGLEPTPALGGRLLLVPFLFWSLGVVSFLSTLFPGCLVRLVIQPVMLLWLFSWGLKAEEAILGWNEPAIRNRKAITAAWQTIRYLAEEVQVVVLPSREVPANRLVRVGDALPLAIETMASWEGIHGKWVGSEGSASMWLELPDYGGARRVFGELSDPVTSGAIVLSAPPVGDLVHQRVAEVREVSLVDSDRLTTETVEFGSASLEVPGVARGRRLAEEGGLCRPITVRQGEFLSLEGEWEGAMPGSGSLQLLDGEGRVVGSAPVTYPSPGWGTRRFSVTIEAAAHARSLRYVPSTGPSPFALRTLTARVYTLGG